MFVCVFRCQCLCYHRFIRRLLAFTLLGVLATRFDVQCINETCSECVFRAKAIKQIQSYSATSKHLIPRESMNTNKLPTCTVNAMQCIYYNVSSHITFLLGLKSQQCRSADGLFLCHRHLYRLRSSSHYSSCAAHRWRYFSPLHLLLLHLRRT